MKSAIHKKSRSAWIALVGGVLLSWIALVCSTMFVPVKKSVFMDEVYWVGSTYYYNLLFQPNGLSSDDWQLLPARENPPLAKYMLGAWMSSRGRDVESLDMLAFFYAWDLGARQNWKADWNLGPLREKFKIAPFAERVVVVRRGNLPSSEVPTFLDFNNKSVVLKVLRTKIW